MTVHLEVTPYCQCWTSSHLKLTLKNQREFRMIHSNVDQPPICFGKLTHKLETAIISLGALTHQAGKVRVDFGSNLYGAPGATTP